MAVKRQAEAYWVESRNRWQINVQKNGVRKTFTASTPGKKGKHEAEAKADKWLERCTSAQRLEVALELFLEDKEKDVAAVTYRQIKSKANVLLRKMSPQKRLNMITIHDWQRVLDDLVNEGMAESSAKQFRSFVREFVVYAYRRRWDIEKFDTEELTIKSNARPKKQKEAYDINEIAILLGDDVEGEWWVNAFRFALFTGFRINEVCGLQWQDIDFVAKVINVSRGVDALGNITTGKTGNVIRTVALSKYAENILTAQKKRLEAARVKSEFVFPARSGNLFKYTNIKTAWGRIKAHGITHTIHELRHTFISIIDKELPLSLLKKTVGHSSAMDTQRTYSHLVQSDLEDMREGVDNAFGKLKII